MSSLYLPPGALIAICVDKAERELRKESDREEGKREGGRD